MSLIRDATVDDAEAIAAVHVRAWQRAYADLLDPEVLAGRTVEERAEKWREWLVDDGPAVIRVAEVAGRVAGFAAVREAVLQALYVDPVAQGAGVGSALLAEAEAAGASELEVFEGNGHGRRFYEARGWCDAGEAATRLGQPVRRYRR